MKKQDIIQSLNRYADAIIAELTPEELEAFAEAEQVLVQAEPAKVVDAQKQKLKDLAQQTQIDPVALASFKMASLIRIAAERKQARGS